MSLKYKYDELSEKKNNTSQQSDENLVKYETSAQTRNICFVQPSGVCFFLNYAYLISGEYNPDESTITLTFTTHSVTLKGSNLETVVDDLLTHSIKKIVCMGERYKAIRDTGIFVTEIKINKTE